MLVCDVCDKGFHTYCLSPELKTIPPNGWKCLVSGFNWMYEPRGITVAQSTWLVNRKILCPE